MRSIAATKTETTKNLA